MVPDAWSAFFDYQEDLGLLLLQPYGFTMSGPLHLPAEIARLHYN